MESDGLQKKRKDRTQIDRLMRMIKRSKIDVYEEEKRKRKLTMQKY